LTRAGKAMEQIDPQGLAQATGGNMDLAVAISKDLSRAQDFGGISEREIEKIIRDNGVSEAGAQFIRENYAMQTQRGNLGDTLKQGRLTEAQQIERETGRMAPAGQSSRQLSETEAQKAIKFGDATAQREMQKTIEDKMLRQNLGYDDLTIKELDYLLAFPEIDEAIQARLTRGE